MIVEPPEAGPAIGVPSGRELRPHPRQSGLPIADALTHYLDSRIPSWPRLPDSRVDRDESLISEVAQRAAAAAVTNEQERPAKITQRTAARRGLRQADANWAALLVDLVLSGKLKAADVATHLDDQIGIGP